MRHVARSSLFVAIVILLGFAGSLGAQEPAQAHRSKTASQVVLENWNYIGNKLITMAEDWPEDKYTYRLNSQVRTFQQVLLHVAGSNFGLLNQISGKKLGEGANDPSVDSYKSKAQTVEFLKKSVAEGAAMIQKEGDAGVLKHLNDWIGYTEHMGEHYGLLVAYYRNNGVVPPDSRPKK